MKKKIKHINPGNGLGELLFGFNKKEVIKIIGEADKVTNEKVGGENSIEVWEYDELGLSIRFDGMDAMELTSVSVISSYYQYNGINIIGESLKKVRSILKDVQYQILYDDESHEQKVLFSKQLSLVILFDHDIATSLSWDLSELDPRHAKMLKKFGVKKSKSKPKKKNFSKPKKKPKPKLKPKKSKKRKDKFPVVNYLLFMVVVVFTLTSFFLQGSTASIVFAALAGLYLLILLYHINYYN